MRIAAAESQTPVPMSRHPIILLAISLIGGILAAPLIPISYGCAAAGALAVSAVAGVYCNRRMAASLLLCGLFFALGVLRTHLQEAARREADLRDVPAYARIEAVGVVAGMPRLVDDRMRFDLQLRSLRVAGKWRGAASKVRISAPRDSTLQVDDQVAIAGNLVWPISENNPGDFNYRRYLHAGGIVAEVRIRRDGFIGRLPRSPAAGHSLSYRRWQTQRQLTKILDSMYAPEVSAILQGLLLGNRSDISDETREAFVRTGIVHVLAVSGLHVGLILAILMFMARLFRLRGAVRFAVLLAGVWSYAWLTGANPPVIRAGFMASLYLFGEMRDRRLSAANFLGASAFVILLWNPLEIYASGFQLSFAAVAAILFLYPKLLSGCLRWQFLARLRRLTWVRWLMDMSLVSLSAQLGTVPLAAASYGVVSIVGVFANLIVIPAIFVAVAAAFAALVLYFLFPVVAAALAVIASGGIRVVLWLSDRLAALSWASLDGWFPGAFFLWGYFALLLVVFYWQRPRLRFAGVMLLLAVLNMGVWSAVTRARQNLEITFLSVGQGDAAFVRFPHGRKLLVDVGPRSPGYDTGERIILPYLRRQGVHHVDMILLSHPHLDHIGGLQALVAALRPACVVIADTVYRAEAYRGLVALLRRAHVPVQIAVRGSVLDAFLPAQLLVLGPDPRAMRASRNLNESSLVIQLRYGRASALFMGDAELGGEKALGAYRPLLQSSLLKAGHHGSATSSSEQLLGMVRPRWAIISAGAFNRFNHPGREVMQRFSRFAVDTVRTDLNGAAVFRSDGATFVRVK